MMLVTVMSPHASSSSSVEANATRIHLSMPVTQADASVYLAALSSRSLLLVLPRCVQLLLPKANGTGGYSLRVAVTSSSASIVPEPDISRPEVIPGYQMRVSNGSATNATYVVATLPLPSCVLRPEDWLLPVRASAVNGSREFPSGDVGVLASDVGGLTPEQIAAFTNLSRELGLGFDTVAAFFGQANATANLTAASRLAEVGERLRLTAEQVEALSTRAVGVGATAAAGERSPPPASRPERALAGSADGRQIARDWPTPQATRVAVSFSATTAAPVALATSGGSPPPPPPRLASTGAGVTASRAELLGNLTALLGDLQRLTATGDGNLTSERAVPLLGRTSAMLNSLGALRDGGGGVRDDAAAPGAAEDEELLRNGTAVLTRWFPVLVDFARSADRVPTVTDEPPPTRATGGEAAASPPGGSGSRPVAPLSDAVRLRWRAMVEPGQRAAAAQPGDLFRLGAEDCVKKLESNPGDVNCNPLLDPSAFYRVNLYVFLNDTAVAETGWSGPLQPHQKPSGMPASVPVFGGRSGGMVVITVILMVLLFLLLLVFIVSLVVKR
uniref:Uncharacterized protein LOC116937827 n=1 Tax=Petromyzon marinus TaxID=7757 RepID=A0AAJ7SKL8_PETMA|nr:uncharacterized protein LOC116937827 [Petromyzon marinus]